MIRKAIQILFHGLCVANYVLFLKHSRVVGPELDKIIPNRAEFGGDAKFLTHWNVYLHLVFFALALMDDLASNSSLRRLLDFFFTSIAFPLGMFVTVSFWGIYAMDRNLIHPPLYDKYFPPLYNHMMHTTPLVSMLVELLISYHAYPKKSYVGIVVNVALSTGYVAWTFYVAHAGGFWIYPFLEVLSLEMRAAFLAFSCVVSMAFYMLGKWLVSITWSKYCGYEDSAIPGLGASKAPSKANGDTIKQSLKSKKQKYYNSRKNN